MKKFFQIILGVSFLLLLVGCSSQETATFTQKSGDTDVTLVYTYDKKTDTEASKDNEKLFESMKGLNGVVTSITEKDGKLISSVEVDLTKYTLSKLKENNNLFFAGLLQSGFLTEDGDHVSFSKSKEVALKRGMTEQTK